MFDQGLISTSSTMMWVRELRCLSCWSFLSKTPVVQYSRRVHSPDWFSIRIWYPHSDD